MYEPQCGQTLHLPQMIGPHFGQNALCFPSVRAISDSLAFRARDLALIASFAVNEEDDIVGCVVWIVWLGVVLRYGG